MPKHIFIFNPETDYALAIGHSNYNPPARIARLRRDMQLIPARIASPGDYLLVSDDFNLRDYADRELVALVKDKGIITIREDELHDIVDASEWNLLPWGWNHTIRRKLLDLGMPASLLKSEEEIDTLRELSHRRTTIPFQHYLQSLMPGVKVPVAHEFFNIDEAIKFLKCEKDVYFKAPWSSSGRGVIHVCVESDNYNAEKLHEWLGGFIRKQGGVMGEKAFNRMADFATEWMLKDGKATFKGLSLFRTTTEGRYIGNQSLSQDRIYSTLHSLSPHWNEDVIAAQSEALEKIVVPGYSGPAGIDMLIDSDGRLNPCVEINLRFTMGMIALGPSILE